MQRVSRQKLFFMFTSIFFASVVCMDDSLELRGRLKGHGYYWPVHEDDEESQIEDVCRDLGLVDEWSTRQTTLQVWFNVHLSARTNGTLDVRKFLLDVKEELSLFYEHIIPHETATRPIQQCMERVHNHPIMREAPRRLPEIKSLLQQEQERNQRMQTFKLDCKHKQERLKQEQKSMSQKNNKKLMKSQQRMQIAHR
jgi:hypothetical protein